MSINERTRRDVERLTGRRRDKTQRAILWNELEELAQKLFRLNQSGEFLTQLAQNMPVSAMNRNAAIRAINQLIDSTNLYIANEAARLDAEGAARDSIIQSVQVAVADAQAAVDAEIVARSDGDVALAQDITNVQASLAAANASVSINSSAIATIESYQAASYSLRLAAGGAAAGLEIVASDDPINGAASALRMQADNILLDGSVFAHHINVADLVADTGFINNLTVTNANISGTLTADRIQIDDAIFDNVGGEISVSQGGITQALIGTDAATAMGASSTTNPASLNAQCICPVGCDIVCMIYLAYQPTGLAAGENADVRVRLRLNGSTRVETYLTPLAYDTNQSRTLMWHGVSGGTSNHTLTFESTDLGSGGVTYTSIIGTIFARSR